MLTYPKPLTISQHTLHAVKTPNLTRRERAALVVQARLHSRVGPARSALLLAKKGLPAATMNTVVQSLIPPPKYDVDAADAGRRHGHRGAARGHGRDRARRRAAAPCSTPSEALETLMENCDDAYGFPPYPVIEDFLHSSRNGADLRASEREIDRARAERRADDAPAQSIDHGLVAAAAALLGAAAVARVDAERRAPSAAIEPSRVRWRPMPLT